MAGSKIQKAVVSLAVVAIVAIAGLTVPATAGAAAVQHTSSAHFVSLTCPYGDHRSYTDASVQPGVIVPDTSGWPWSPVTYTPYTVEPGGQLQPIGPGGTIFTTDPLVAVWQNSTDCSGAADSRNSWVTDSSGSVFTESDLSGPPTQNFGDMGGHHLNQPMVGMTPTSDSQGYWEVASDGGIFAFGDAGFHGSMGASHLNKPIEAMVPTPDGQGYWMVASDGGIFAFGDAPFYGSTGGMVLPSPISGMVPNGSGYTLIAQNGTEYPFSGPPIATPPGPAPGAVVPNLIGQNGLTALNTLNDDNFVWTNPGSTCFNSGWIVSSESPSPGTEVFPYSTVTIGCS